MKSLFLICEPLLEYGGISMKILAQEKALERLGFQVVLSELKTDNKNKFTGRYIGEKIIDNYSNINFISKIQFRIKYGNLYRYIVTNEIKLVYIRYAHFANPFFISFLKKLKRSDIKVLLEIPTYPYDQEYNNLKITNEVLMWIEKLSRKKFKDLVSRIITFTPEMKIFGVPSIEISNGIEVSSIKIAEQRAPDNAIHLIGVASIAYWHGYDRVIEGMHNYYLQNPDRRKIFFHIVGNAEDEESRRYHDFVNEYNLSNYIKFYGKKFGKELDILFNDADIAVGCLGCHRKGMKYSKSLKNREYCARGIPFFYSETDEPFENQNFIFKVPADESPIDIDEIIKFYDGNKFDRNNIRNYAFRNLSWDKQFEKVMKNVFPKMFQKDINKVV
jgi:hypothetical protein